MNTELEFPRSEDEVVFDFDLMYPALYGDYDSMRALICEEAARTGRTPAETLSRHFQRQFGFLFEFYHRSYPQALSFEDGTLDLKPCALKALSQMWTIAKTTAVKAYDQIMASQ
jgi:hypothetical protein